MSPYAQTHCTAFEGARCIASGELRQVALAVKVLVERGHKDPVIIFDDATGQSIEVDFRGSVEDVLRRLTATASADEPPVSSEIQRGPGRPKLGVVGREVTLLPRHWEWLNSQPGGASIALRKLVEEARRANDGKQSVRKAQEAVFRFMSTLAGNRPGFEEAVRALFAGEHKRFDMLIEAWPADIRGYTRKLAAAAFEPQSAA